MEAAEARGPHEEGGQQNQGPVRAAGFLIGDFNFSEGVEETYHMEDGGSFHAWHSDLAKTLSKLFPSFLEAAQDDYTCRSGTILSRLDRVYTNLMTATACDVKPYCRTAWALLPREASTASASASSLSDHVPIPLDI